jgi:hypothetical protein
MMLANAGLAVLVWVCSTMEQAARQHGETRR